MAVSLALRGKPGVSEATREQVLKTARDLGYAPDPEVANLMARIRSKKPAETKACLALLTSGATEQDWKRYTTERMYVEGAQARAREYGYRLESFWLNNPDMPPARLGNIIWNRGIEGVLIAPLQGRLSGKTPRSIELDFGLFAAVEISETVEWPDLDRAIHDQYSSMLKLLHELEALDYRSIGLVLEESLDLRVNGKWTAAYLQHRHRAHAGQLVPPLIMGSSRRSVFDRWYDRYRPDVVVSVNGFGLGFIQQRGLDVPGEVGYASLDLAGVATRRRDLSGIDQNSRQVGAAAVDMLVAAIQRGQRGIPEHPVRTQIAGTWVPGKSTARPKSTVA
jgi:LacI family transcriptional regulator